MIDRSIAASTLHKLATTSVSITTGIIVLQLLLHLDTNSYSCTAQSIDTIESGKATETYSEAFLAEANDYNITNRVVDIFFFTQYCGPNSRLAQRFVQTEGTGKKGRKRIIKNTNSYGASGQIGARVTYAELDECCRQHDNCANYITEPQHYELYPGLERRSQYFARMECSCDGIFYQCLNGLKSRYASTVAIGYGIVQSFCFEYEHPIVRCARRSLWRCESYVVDGNQPKRWQWFDVPPAYKKIFSIPQVTVEGSSNGLDELD